MGLVASILDSTEVSSARALQRRRSERRYGGLKRLASPISAKAIQ